MAVETTVTNASFTGTGVSSTYAPGFYVNSSDQVVVTVDGVLQTLGDDYVVNNVGASQGCNIVATFANGSAVYIERVTPITQLVDTQNNETILEDVIDAGFDKLTMIAQELKGQTNRALLFPKGESGQTLGNAASRASKFLAFDALGGTVLSSGTGADAGLRTDLAAPGGVGLVGNAVQYVDTIAALAAASVFIKHARLTLLGRAGNWTLRTRSDYTALIAADTLNGLTVVSTVDATKVWVRDWNLIDGHPEWFGSQVGNSGFDNRAAILACYALCPITRLQASDYWIAGKLIFNRGYRRVTGPFNPDGYNTGNGTRIISTNGAADVCHARPDATPTTTAGYLRNLTIENICFQHGVTRTLPSVGAEKAAVACLRLEYLIDAKIKGNYANEPVVGFALYALIGSHIDLCRAFRSEVFGGGNDIFIGFLATGAVAPGGLIGNQASLFTDRCNATCAGGARTALVADRRPGFWFDQAFADQFHEKPETLGCNVRITGLGENDTTPGTGDFYINSPVVDQVDGISYDIQGVGKTGMVRLLNPYCGIPAEPNAGASPNYGVRMQNIGGKVLIFGGELNATPNNNSIGISFESSNGVLETRNVSIEEFSRPLGIDASKNFDLHGSISCHLNTPLSAIQGAVAMTNAQRGKIDFSIVGKANAYPQGVIGFGALNDKIEINATRIDPACIQGGATNKIVINSTALTAPGNYAPAGTSGAAGDGILVSGITA